jgi:hypothetical protein
LVLFAGFFDFLVIFLADFFGAFAALAIVFAAFLTGLGSRLAIASVAFFAQLSRPSQQGCRQQRLSQSPDR